MLCTIFLITAALLVHITGQQQTNKSGLCNNMTCAYGKCEQMECKCDPGITGKQCDIDIKDCEQEACLNGGTCIELVNGFSCQCSQWYYGFRCQYAISLIHFPCLSYKCLNGGTCVMVNDEPKCLCNNQYDGLKCEHYLNQPKSCNVLQCYNGGTCIAVGMPPLFDLYCLCKKNHQGAKCELNATPYSAERCSFETNLSNVSRNTVPLKYEIVPVPICPINWQYLEKYVTTINSKYTRKAANCTISLCPLEL